MAGTDNTRNATTGPGPAVILVNPQLGENIGAAARAMKNFGLSDLRLVAPRDSWPNEKAQAMSRRADDIIDAARVFDSAREAVADLHRIYATSARRRDLLKPVMSPRGAGEHMRGAVADGQNVGLLFGAERAGLDNDDVALAQVLIHVPANPAFASLNLGQAVLLIGYEWFVAGQEIRALEANPVAAPPASAADVQHFLDRLEGHLLDGGFLYPPEKAPSMWRRIQGIFQRIAPTDQDVRTLEGIVSTLLKAGKRSAGGRKNAEK